MTTNVPTERHDVIAESKHASTLYLLPLGEPCGSLAARVVAEVPKPRVTSKGSYGRDVRLMDPDKLSSLPAKGSWTLAVLFCGGDDTSFLNWAKRASARVRGRVTFYLQGDHDVPASWPDLAPRRAALTTLSALKHDVLDQLNDQTYEDYADAKPPGVR